MPLWLGFAFAFGRWFGLLDYNLRRVLRWTLVAVVAAFLRKSTSEQAEAQRQDYSQQFLSNTSHQFQPPHAVNGAHGRESGDAPTPRGAIWVPEKPVSGAGFKVSYPKNLCGAQWGLVYQHEANGARFGWQLARDGVAAAKS